MRPETFTLSQKELQRATVLSTCLKGELACARAGELLCMSVRHVKRLKKRLREAGVAPMAHANRGRPSHRRLPDEKRKNILRLARTKCLGFNDHHLAEKLNEAEGLTVSRECLRRDLHPIFRAQGDMIFGLMNRSHFLTQAKLEVAGSLETIVISCSI